MKNENHIKKILKLWTD